MEQNQTNNNSYNDKQDYDADKQMTNVLNANSLRVFKAQEFSRNKAVKHKTIKSNKHPKPNINHLIQNTTYKI